MSGKRVLRFKKLNPFRPDFDFFARAAEHGMTPNEYLAFVNKVNMGSERRARRRNHATSLTRRNIETKTDLRKLRRE